AGLGRVGGGGSNERSVGLREGDAHALDASGSSRRAGGPAGASPAQELLERRDQRVALTVVERLPEVGLRDGELGGELLQPRASRVGEDHRLASRVRGVLAADDALLPLQLPDALGDVLAVHVAPGTDLRLAARPELLHGAQDRVVVAGRADRLAPL